MSESRVDVLIIGAGPAGLMAAQWMSRCSIKARIIDMRVSKRYNGGADGLQSRTLEVFESFGFANRAWLEEANHMLEICFWNPDENGAIHRSDRIPDNMPGNSRYQQCVIHQGRIERWFMDSMRKEGNGMKVEYGVLPQKMVFDDSKAEDLDAHPVTVHLRHLSEEEANIEYPSSGANGVGERDGQPVGSIAADDLEERDARLQEVRDKAGRTEVIQAKYVIGCDGAHSWVRKQLDLRLEGDTTDLVWGVMDIIPITDFPDIRMRCAIHSASDGTIMVIPREKKLVRLYIQLMTVGKGEDGRADRSTITPEFIIKSAQKILAPYKLEYHYCDWWTAYQIGQRVGNSYSLRERIFLAGDAVHTHSPKAGQGMNVSMADTYNLGWKLINVLRGVANRSILKTYQSERRRVAQDLIEFDRSFSKLFSGRPTKDVMDEEGIDPSDLKAAFSKSYAFLAGSGLDYGASMLIAREGDPCEQGDGSEVTRVNQVQSKQSLATELKPGSRMPSCQVLSQADSRPWQFQELLPSNGCWRIVVFAGNITETEQRTRMENIGQALAAPDSFLDRFTPPNAPPESVFEVLAVHSAARTKVTIFDLPEIFRRYSDVDGYDYYKIFVDDKSHHKGHGHAYNNWGIDPRGCVVVLRPDQHVSYVGELDDYQSLDSFFAGFMIKQS